MSDKTKAKNETKTVAAATAPAMTPAEQALARIKEAKAKAKAELAAAKKEAAALDPDYAGPGCGVIAMLTKSERDAFNAKAAARGKSARELAREALLAVV